MTPDELATSDSLPRLGSALQSFVALAIVAVFFTGLDNYAFTAWSGPPPLHWVYLSITAGVAVVATRASRPMPFLTSPLVSWTFAFFLVTTIWALFMRPSTGGIQLLRARYLSLAFLVTCAVIFDESRVRRAGLLAVAFAVAFASAVNIAEMVGLLDFTRFDAPTAERVGRAAGFYVNPNGSGMIIALGLAVAVPALSAAWRIPFLLLCSFGVAATVSRGATICLAVVILALAWRGTLGASRLLLGALCGALIAVLLVDYLQQHDLVTSLMRQRFTLQDDDDSGRIAVATKAWRIFLEAPFFGKGLGATVDWDVNVSSHNMYANLAGDHGVIGLLLFPTLCLAVVAKPRRVTAFSLALLVAGVFSHNLLDDRAILLAIALAASVTRAAEDTVRDAGVARARRAPPIAQAR